MKNPSVEGERKGGGVSRERGGEGRVGGRGVSEREGYERGRGMMKCKKESKVLKLLKKISK